VKQHNYMYEVTVGGGLRIITSLQAMLIGGDRILRLEGSLSASMNFVLGLVSPAPSTLEAPAAMANGNHQQEPEGNAAAPQPVALSQAVAEATRLDVLERNPMNDLNGVEMAQKLLVLAREMGVPLRLDDVAIETLLPPGTGFEDVGKHDAAVAARVAAAAERGAVLRYVATIDEEGRAAIGIREVPYAHPFATVRGAGYCFRIFSQFHSPDPITIQGTIGSPKATAAGLFSDLLFVAQRLGAKDKGHTLQGQGILSDSVIEP
jgi:bifunctional aspartokinase / homoserine dehydrogenase 1